MKNSLLLAAALVGTSLLATSATAQNVVTNGNFSAGLTGWTVYTTTNGTYSLADTTTFNVSGNGTQTTARLRVGDTDGAFNSTFGGAGLSQQVTTLAGLYSFSANIAVYDASAFDNLSAGHFSVLVDGTTMNEVDFDFISSGQTLRGVLSFTSAFSAGAHLLAMQATRNGIYSDNTPYQFFTNVSLAAANAAVPEPATWAMMIAGFGMVGFAMRRRQRVRVSYAA